MAYWNYSLRTLRTLPTQPPLSLWGSSTGQVLTGKDRSRKFPRHLDDKFLAEDLREVMWRGALCALLLVPREALVGEVVTGGCLGLNDHENTDFQISDAAGTHLGPEVAH